MTTTLVAATEAALRCLASATGPNISCRSRKYIGFGLASTR